MKRSELSVGMVVENRYGGKRTVTTIDGKDVRAAWHGRDGTLYGDPYVRRAKDLSPVGTFENRRADEKRKRMFADYQRDSNARIAQAEALAIVHGKLLAFWGDDYDAAMEVGWDYRAMHLARLHYASHAAGARRAAEQAAYRAGWTDALDELRRRAERMGHHPDCEAFMDLNDSADYGIENIQPTGEPCTCMHDAFIKLINTGGSDPSGPRGDDDA